MPPLLPLAATVNVADVVDWDDVQRAMPEGVTLGEIFPTACPVQIVGDIVGQPFYFRARDGVVTLGVGGSDPVANPLWYGWREDADAGWLTPAETAGYLVELVDEWRRRPVLPNTSVVS
jgi:hypothetical protein